MKHYVGMLSAALLGLANISVCATSWSLKPVPPAVATSPAAAASAPTTANSKPAIASGAPSTTPVKAVTTVGLGQAGYVHYFLITHPDGDLEYQVGVELHDQRIAWSFPEAGVIVSTFIKAGVLTVNGKTFKVEHLHGIRPFVRDTDMHVLQKELPRRVANWIDDETPYCLLRQPGQPFCLSCGDFVVRILYPGTHPLIPALPRDFLRTTGSAYTTDDLLLYFVGLHGLPDKRAMLNKLATLQIPAVMREDITAMLENVETAPPATVAEKPAPATNASAKAQPAIKPAGTGRLATRRTQGKKI